MFSSTAGEALEVESKYEGGDGPTQPYLSISFEVDTTEVGRPPGTPKIDASLWKSWVTVEKLKWTIQHGEQPLEPDRRHADFLLMYKNNGVKWEPFGVIAACISWKCVLDCNEYVVATIYGCYA